jgi:hypothetical protein
LRESMRFQALPDKMSFWEEKQPLLYDSEKGDFKPP